MQKAISLKLLPEEAATDNIIKAYIAGSIGNKPEDISGFIITKKSIDARGKQAWVNLTLTAYINEPVQLRKNCISFSRHPQSKKISHHYRRRSCRFIAALKLIELGIKPVLLERGKDVKQEDATLPCSIRKVK
jgi:hypothetical protein